MDINITIEALNNNIMEYRDNNGISCKSKLILLKTIIPDTKFKAYKHYSYTLYYVKGKNKQVLLDIKETIKVSNNEDNSETKAIIIRFLKELFTFIQSEDFIKIKNGIL